MSRLMANENAPPTTWKKRLQGMITGGICVAIGWWLVSHKVLFMVSERYRQPMFAWAAVAMGVVMIAVSAAPARLIIRMTSIRKYQPYQWERPAADAKGSLTPPRNPK